jgi:hypothetical protein
MRPAPRRRGIVVLAWLVGVLVAVLAAVGRPAVAAAAAPPPLAQPPGTCAITPHGLVEIIDLAPVRPPPLSKSRVRAFPLFAAARDRRSSSDVPGPRWGKGPRYDDLVVGLTVYVNGDPVNLVDPDGHCAKHGPDRDTGDFGACQREMARVDLALDKRIAREDLARLSATVRAIYMHEFQSKELLLLEAQAQQLVGFLNSPLGELDLGLASGASGLLSQVKCLTTDRLCADREVGTALMHPLDTLKGLVDYQDFAGGHVARGIGNLAFGGALALGTGGVGRLTGGFGRGLMAGGIVPSEADISAITAHLNRSAFVGPGEAMVPENVAMLDRLTAASSSGVPLLGADLHFYLHELREKVLMDAGMGWTEAHPQTMAELGQEPWQLYHPSVIDQFPESFNNYYRTHAGLEPK